MNTGLVVIGRNEAEKLGYTLPKLRDVCDVRVYVDSGSTDDSVAIARRNSFEVVTLSTDTPFTAARARNTGVRCLLEKEQPVDYLMFLDGDCELNVDFLSAAVREFSKHKEAGIVTGHLRERHPGASIYNTICDVEWNGPVGEIDACGGIFMIRTTLFESLDGFDESIIAAEDTELCLRVRSAGFKIVRIDSDMAIHDANMHTFKQWWLRAVRAGYAFADCKYRYRNEEPPMFESESRRSLVFGSIAPLSMLTGLALHPIGFFGLLFYPLQAVRIERHLPDRIEKNQRWPYAVNCAVATVPQWVGHLKFYWDRFRNRQGKIIEYK